MPDKSALNPFDLTNLMPQFSNWAFAEREDKLEERTVAGFQRVQRNAWEQAEKAFDDHMAFMSHRFHEDFECAKALGDCRMPDEAFATLQSFYVKMADEYQAHFKKQIENFQNGLTESIASAEELGETAVQAASELAQATEESIEEAAKPKRRSRASAAK